MKAAIVQGLGQLPVFGEFREPEASAGENLVSVTAAALSPLARARAAGTHYSSTRQFPFVAGVDGVGRLDDGRRVYFIMPNAPFGAMSQRTVAPSTHILPLPDDLDDVTAAAIAIPGMSSWAAYAERALLRKGETVLVNGATGASGRLAVQIAKRLGAAKVIATARNVQALESLAALGADVMIPLVADGAALESAFKPHFVAGVDVVVDYLWGPSAERLLVAAAKAGKDGAPIRFVQIGSASGADITLPGAALRASAITLMGSGIGSVPFARLLHAIGEVLGAAGPAGFAIATKSTPLAEVESAWPLDDAARRLVFTVS